VKGPLVPLVWAALLAIHTIVLIALGGKALEVLLLAGAAVGAAAVAALMTIRAGGTGRVKYGRSAPAVLAAVAVAGLALGAELGQWLVLISAGALALALAGMLRERLR
jgi:hypothetical protein